ncbi:MAG: inositol monophosphatase [Deltaproteobacteria bacterium]|nr:inositol monophosphatase [Deltaproteobacteria bacterium]
MTELDVALEAARAAGAILADRGGGPARIRHKGLVDLVTEVDLACEAAVLEVLERHTPEIPILSEEKAGDSEADTRWVVDPLDGTTNYVHGFPVYAVSVALEVDGEGFVAVIFDPVRGLAYTARRGAGAWCNGARMQVSDCRDLGQALVGTGFPYDRREGDNARFYTRYLEAMIRNAQGVRRAGAAAMDLAMLAAGNLDAFWEFKLRWWDVAAGRLLVEEAGGRFSGHDGGEVDRSWPSPLVTNGWLHEQMMVLLERV